MQLIDIAPLCINFMHFVHIKCENQHIMVHDIA